MDKVVRIVADDACKGNLHTVLIRNRQPNAGVLTLVTLS